MKFCPKCGKQIEDHMNLCAECAAAGQKSGDFMNDVKKLLDTADTTAQFDPADIEKNKIMAVLAYFGLLVLIPIFAAKDSKFARYHANQGLLLTIVSYVWGLVSSLIAGVAAVIAPVLGIILGTVFGLVDLVFLAAMILGIINVLNGKAKALPIIGAYTILK